MSNPNEPEFDRVNAFVDKMREKTEGLRPDPDKGIIPEAKGHPLFDPQPSEEERIKHQRAQDELLRKLRATTNSASDDQAEKARRADEEAAQRRMEDMGRRLKAKPAYDTSNINAALDDSLDATAAEADPDPLAHGSAHNLVTLVASARLAIAGLQPVKHFTADVRDWWRQQTR